MEKLGIEAMNRLAAGFRRVRCRRGAEMARIVAVSGVTID